MSAIAKHKMLSLPQGYIKGMKRLSIYDDDYYSFEGIPFAKPPVGELRFRAPVPSDSWTGIKDCTNYASKAVQKNVFTGEIEGSEDCLYLNVYAKKLTSDKPLPVMVYIYGGGFYMGEATRELYSPDYFMSKNIVLVTLNYRVCSLGFLSLKDQSLQVPGNAGLKDQIMALRWVKNNISHFNGDVENITLFGESAGGGSTHILSLTEQTRGLFHKAIPMSGCAINGWASPPQTDSAYRLAKFHGYTGENFDRDVLAYLQKLEPSKLVDHLITTDDDFRKGGFHPFAPTPEPYVTDQCVFTKPPFELLKNAWSNDIPFMHGGTSFEGLLMYRRLKLFPQMMSLLANDPIRFVPADVQARKTPEEAAALGEMLKKLHFGDKLCNADNLFCFLDFYSYSIFWHGFHRTILARLAYAKADTYLYRFDFDSPDFNHYRKKLCGDDPVRGVAHADDLSYLWYTSYSWKLSKDSEEYKTIKRMIGIWTSFAQNSNPNCDEIKPLEWLPVSGENPNIAFNISNDLTVIELPEKAKLDVWDSLYTKDELY